MKKAFTLIELIVAVSLLAMVLFFSSAVFNVSIDAYRTAVANAEIMQKCRAITDQLNYDFKAVKDSSFYNLRSTQMDQSYNMVTCQMAQSQIPNDPIVSDVRSDQILFVTAGDFQSTYQYDNKTVSGNVACIFYSLANTNLPDPRKKILIRRQTIMVPENAPSGGDPNGKNEFNTISLSQWKEKYRSGIGSLMDKETMDITKNQDLAKYMAKGVDDFTIECVSWDSITKKMEWRPYTNKTDAENKTDFDSYNKKLVQTKAFKFSFTLYDSMGIIREGRRFTHIVYIGD